MLIITSGSRLEREGEPFSGLLVSKNAKYKWANQQE